MKKLILLSVAVMLNSYVFSQIHMTSTGNVGIGSVTNPQARFELEDQRWMMFNAHDNSTGLLFHESAGKTASSIQYGGKIVYDENNDALILGSYENWSSINALWINRQGGGIGIGDNLWGTTYKLKVYGRAVTTESIWETSDIRFKENIEDLKNETDLLKQLRGVSYVKKESVNQSTLTSNVSQNTGQSTQNDLSQQNVNSVEMKTPIIPEREYGFIAQEVREILPDLVIEDEEGYLAINYTGVIPLLVEAYKNLQTQVEYLENRISDCCQESNLKSASLLSGNEENLSTENTLYQNTPNPFSVSTTIRYSLSKNVNNAMIYIYNMNGTQLKSIELHQIGEGSIQINGGEFNAGMYLYSLIADGQIIDTKRMILTD
ncbi:MAG: tail fiber domain-containing protein [Mariniphaga sp.]